jgi:hypothetical protein
VSAVRRALVVVALSAACLAVVLAVTEAVLVVVDDPRPAPVKERAPRPVHVVIELDAVTSADPLLD